MKKISILIFLLFCVSKLVAKEEVLTLDDAVFQVKKHNSGHILSAETFSKVHEIKILSAKGKIKRIRIPIRPSSRKKNIRHNNSIYRKNQRHSNSRHSNHRNSNHSSSSHRGSENRSSGHRKSGSGKSKNK